MTEDEALQTRALTAALLLACATQTDMRVVLSGLMAAYLQAARFAGVLHKVPSALRNTAQAVEAMPEDPTATPHNHQFH